MMLSLRQLPQRSPPTPVAPWLVLSSLLLATIGCWFVFVVPHQVSVLDSMILKPGPEHVSVGQGWRRSDGSLGVQLSARGEAIVGVSLSGEMLLDRPMLATSFAGGSTGLDLEVLAQPQALPIRLRIGAVRIPRGQQTTLYLGAWESADAPLRTLFLRLRGAPNIRLAVGPITLKPISVSSLIANLRLFWTSPKAWVLRSTNMPTGFAPELMFLQPVPALSTLAVLTTLIALALTFSLRSMRRSGREVLSALGIVMLLFWVVLDSIWSDRQRKTTREATDRYAGKTESERIAASPAAAYAAASERIRSALRDTAPTRILVASRDDYRGMRLAYELYPWNVFWSRKYELPEPSLLRKGDVIVLVDPSEHRVSAGALMYPRAGYNPVPVEELLVERQISVLRIL